MYTMISCRPFPSHPGSIVSKLRANYTDTYPTTKCQPYPSSPQPHRIFNAALNALKRTEGARNRRLAMAKIPQPTDTALHAVFKLPHERSQLHLWPARHWDAQSGMMASSKHAACMRHGHGICLRQWRECSRMQGPWWSARDVSGQETFDEGEVPGVYHGCWKWEFSISSSSGPSRRQRERKIV